MIVTLSHVNNETPHIKTYQFSSDIPVNYLAGQFIELTLPRNTKDKDKNLLKHWFTLSSSPTEKNLAITTKFMSNKLSIYKQRLSELHYREKLFMSEPMGDFVLPKDMNTPLVFIAAGIGITPFRSMVKFLVDKQKQMNIHLIYIINDKNDLVFMDIFEQLDIKTNHVITSSHQKDKTIEEVIRLLDTIYNNQRIYLAGPEFFVQTLSQKIISAGIQDSNILTDFFPGYKNF